jgi:CBS domain-containing protein
MKQGDISDVLVTEPDGRLCGILTDRDIVVRAIAEQLDPVLTAVGEICSGAPSSGG